MEKLLVFIPAYNCEKQVTRVLSQLLDKRIAPWVGECIVVNNRATDGTESAVQDWMARHPDAPVRLLRKTRNPPAQSTMADPAGRRANVSGAYEPERAERLDGRRVLLIDDIVTTGATLAECSRVLRTAGASDVVYAAFAAPRKQD